MDFQEALKEIRNNGFGFKLLIIRNPKERARKLMDLLPETSSWDQETIEELFEILKTDHLRQAREGVSDVI